MLDQKIRVAVLFGGQSGEHDVSVRSAAGILTSLDRSRYDIMPVRINHDGVWTTAPLPELGTIDAVLDWQHNHFLDAGDTTPAASILATLHELSRCDVVFPVLHGPFGEDGKLQALLDALGIPFVGNGVAASALSMDKEYTKKIAAGIGLEVSDSVVLRRGEVDVAPVDRERLGLPVFVKPARDGSSIGVSRVDDWAELPAAVETARKSDEKVLVEAAVAGREIDLGVLEHPDGELEVSPPLEIRLADSRSFFDYTAKYADSATVLEVPATVDPATGAGLAEDAVRLFRALDCSGLLRIDFFLRPDGRRVVNEVNTLPGFTSASQYPRMWQAAGLSYSDLLDELIATARSRAAQTSTAHR
ncbi:D-alanine--D-alanine ligase family protein [Amycolatopsis sp. NPDC023774]|uniref:D-alanine--D-alanine ligase family protein n=1 Tax=Amycolatopsis sp. NPDC023774 TaxID=3155015 RepID=UPI0033FD1C34